jgi:hypothetical protein
MNVTEIKKEMYKQKPEARIQYIRKGFAYYYSDLENDRVYFKIPISDMGDADFLPSMDGKHLLRWLYINE